jgi:hypothetical protein
MKTKKYKFAKKYGDNTYTISVHATDTQIRFFYDDIYVGNIKYKKQEKIIGCKIINKDTYVFIVSANNTRHVYTFNTVAEAVIKAEGLFHIKIPLDVIDTFSSNELLLQLANKV